MGWRQQVRGLRLDVTPLRRSRDFRLLFSAGAVFYFGAMVSVVAVPFQLYDLTGSNLAVGLVGLAELVPLLFFGLWGGALADHVDRRRLLVGAGVAQVVLTALLAVNAFLPAPHVWPIYVMASLLASAGALQRPSREALGPRTVAHEEIPAANALTSFAMQAGVLAGPSVGGLLVAKAGVGWCFTLDATGLVLATLLFAAMRPYPHQGETTPPSLRGIGEGLRYAVGRRDLLGTYLVDVVAMFTAIPLVLFPALAHDVFERPELLGLLFTAEPVGALLATLTSGWTTRVHRHGLAIVAASAGYGASMLIVGLAPTIWWALGGIALAGAFDMVSGVFRMTVWNQTIPDNLRGRLAGIEMLSYSVGPLGGQVRAGLVADLWTVRGSIVGGGLACVGGVLLASAWLRDFVRYDARTDPYAVAERQRRAALSDTA